ncbi:hypothetical protein B6D19_10510 [Gilliamella apicola]|uniref:BRO-N domain-containing protein n=1 Tax=Gilliamella apicola TaxID=1196095 RepID=UPI000A3570F8|nr:BRO family protein [Gilliamella apicola]OTQ30926.1 hypothetical protein B6D19_10510 [Gilliamella apicola]OTQ41205.1 hypothetical protein B6D20_09430 [Gilliamella apicola]
MSNSLVFHNTTIQSVNHNNQIWITSSELAKLLQYKSADSVTKIYNRNSDEFTLKMTETVKLTAPNNLIQTVRIFSLRGAHLIAMLAKTEVAKEVRKWLLDLADKEIGISETISIEQQQAIKQAVNERSYRTGEHHQAIYSKFYEQFKIPRYQDLLASKFDEAIKWLGGVTKARKDMIEVNRTNLICLVHHMLWLNDFYIDNRLYDVFKMLGSDFGVKTHDHFGDGAFVASMFKQQLEKKQLRQV